MINNQFKWMPVLWCVVAAVFIWSGWHPFDRTTWWMEVAPIFIVLPILFLTSPKYKLTKFLYVWIALHAVVLMVGGAYSYARVPLGFWLQDVLGATRNPYDKIGHLMQGLVPALVMRELFIRRCWATQKWVASFAAVCFSLSISLIYELIEWAAAVALGQGADEFLGTQGDVWDTQSDMLMALIGALIAVFVLRFWHDKYIKQKR